MALPFRLACFYFAHSRTAGVSSRTFRCTCMARPAAGEIAWILALAAAGAHLRAGGVGLGCQIAAARSAAIVAFCVRRDGSGLSACFRTRKASCRCSWVIG